MASPVLLRAALLRQAALLPPPWPRPVAQQLTQLRDFGVAGGGTAHAPAAAAALCRPSLARGFAAQPAEAEQPQEAGSKFVRRTRGGQQVVAMQATRRVLPQSPGVIAEPYKGELPPMTWSSLVRLSGYRERWQRFLGGAKSMYTLAKCRRYLKGFSLASLKGDALTTYEDVNAALARGDINRLRQLVTASCFGTMKAQLKAREGGGWRRVEWAFAPRPALSDLELVHARLLAMSKKNDQNSFAQVTLRFHSAQRFAAYDARERLVSGSATAAVPVQDTWVLERYLTGPTARWRVAARLSLAPVPRAGRRTWLAWFAQGTSRRQLQQPRLGAPQRAVGGSERGGA